MIRYREGDVAVRLPLRVQVHMVAVLYGQLPETIREEMPADDFMDALNFRMVTDVR